MNYNASRQDGLSLAILFFTKENNNGKYSLWLVLVNYFYSPGNVGFSWQGFGKDCLLFSIKFVSISNFSRINCWLLFKIFSSFSMYLSRLIGESNWFCNDKININDTHVTLKLDLKKNSLYKLNILKRIL